MLRCLYAVALLSAIFALLLIAAVPAAAQVDRGAIVGTVTDPTGARLSSAQVTITNRDTSQSVHLTTDDEGIYNAKLLKIGTYSVSATKAGFERTVQARVDVAVNQSVRVDLVLKLGAASETVEVTGAAPLLQTESSSLGTVETERRISELPLNGRNFIQLAYLGPGANGGQTGTNVSGGVFENERANEAISVNGLRVSNNNFLLNGVDNNEFGLGGVVVLPPPDAIQEFKTEENSMSAEFGRGGAAVNVVLKSGTNQIHGGVYEFIRNDKLDAVNYFNQGQQPFKRNQFGALSGRPPQKEPHVPFRRLSGIAFAGEQSILVDRAHRCRTRGEFHRSADGTDVLALRDSWSRRHLRHRNDLRSLQYKSELSLCGRQRGFAAESN